MDDSLDAFRQHWTDALAAFGARIEVDVLPEYIEHCNGAGWSGPRLGPGSGAGEESIDRPTSVRVVNREYVTGAVLVEIDEQRDRIAAAFSASLETTNGGGS